MNRDAVHVLLTLCPSASDLYNVVIDLWEKRNYSYIRQCGFEDARGTRRLLEESFFPSGVA